MLYNKIDVLSKMQWNDMKNEKRGVKMMERRKSKGLRMKLLLLTIVPIVLVGVILFLISAGSMQASLQQLSL